jgi:hypothetical protein
LATSQLQHRADYVVTIKGDTLWGKVKYYSAIVELNTQEAIVQNMFSLPSRWQKEHPPEILETISFRWIMKSITP